MSQAVTALAENDLAAMVRQRMPWVEAKTTENRQPFLFVKPDQLIALLSFLRDDPALRFDALMDLTGYDLLKYPAVPPAAPPAAPGGPTSPVSDAICVVYLLFSYTHRHRATVKVHAPRALCRLPSASDVWPAAIYFEREVWDLLGVHFDGHPGLLRIMCPQDWVGHPLRKDYSYPTDYHGVPHLREGQHFEKPPARSSS